MVKAAKRSMKSVLKDADINDEQLITVLCQTESVLNSRPLIYLTSKNKDRKFKI